MFRIENRTLVNAAPNTVEPVGNHPIELCNMRQKMHKLGVAEQSAANLLAKHSNAFIARKIDELEYLLSKHPKKIKKPAGYLYKSITEDYPSPVGYKSPTQKEQEQKLKEAYGIEQQIKQKKERAAEAVTHIRKLMEKKERDVTAQLAKNMDSQTETRLRQFIDENSEEHICSCESYDLRAATIERRKEDFIAGIIFELLRADFFRVHRPEMYASITCRLVAEESGRFNEAQIRYMEKVLNQPHPGN